MVESQKPLTKLAIPRRTLREPDAPNVTYNLLCIEYPELNVSFKLKFDLIHLLLKFSGIVGDN